MDGAMGIIRCATHLRYLSEKFFWIPRFDYGTAKWKEKTVFEFNIGWLGRSYTLQLWRP
jgi:hypothetical protein